MDWVPGPDDRVAVPFSKRALDICLSLLLLLLAMPLAILVWPANVVAGLVWRQDRGPLLHTETRVSQGSPFTLFKFRILTTRAIEEDIRERGARPKDVENRPQNVTHLGRLLKKTGLDETPQLLNVLQGDMSLVGPRPKPVPEYEEGVAEGDWRRTAARAGLTGPAQLLKGTHRTLEDDRRVDLDYLRRLREASQMEALALDLGVLARTVRLMLKMTGE